MGFLRKSCRYFRVEPQRRPSTIFRSYGAGEGRKGFYFFPDRGPG